MFLQKIERIPKPEIQNVLRTSYDGLDDEEKDIFFDIACFFVGEHKDTGPQWMWIRCCDWNPSPYRQVSRHCFRL
ncbi:Disease resistance protein RUN1 [Linum grandiflorum]